MLIITVFITSNIVAKLEYDLFYAVKRIYVNYLEKKFTNIWFCFYFEAHELRKYFKSLGAEISEENSNKGIEDDLHKIIGVCDVCFKDGEPSDIDGILNSIVSIMVSVSIFTN